jgi:hypothetical protein
LRVFIALVLVGGVVEAVAGLYVARTAGVHARTAQDHLEAARRHLEARRLPQAREELRSAEESFAAMDRSIDRIGPARLLIRVTPLVRVQFAATEQFARSGRDLAAAGLDVTDAVAAIEENNTEPLGPAGLDRLKTVDASLQAASKAVDSAVERIGRFDDRRLLGPVGGARNDVARQLPDVAIRVHDASRAIHLLVTALGGDGPRNYLVLSQNPEEIRPTGGFIGSYSVLHGEGGFLKVDRSGATEDWFRAHPAATVADDRRATPFQLDTTVAETLANVNATPQWPIVGHLAADVWESGGEPRVDGVFALTPELLARVVRVLGPVTVPEYGETVTADNLLQRVEYYTHDDPLRATRPGGRKQFLADLARHTLSNLSSLPYDKLEEAGRALSEGMERREGMAWARDAGGQAVFTQHGWDGRVTRGDAGFDFFYAAEFAYSTKTNRAVRRQFDHHVTLRADGSGTVKTTVQANNPTPFDVEDNPTGKAYVVLYGPRGAELANGADPLTASETLGDRPGAGHLVVTPPLGMSRTSVAWKAPRLAEKRDDGTLAYRLKWAAIPAHMGDTLKLSVTPPSGWKWATSPPPSDISLDSDFSGTWVLRKS